MPNRLRHAAGPRSETRPEFGVKSQTLGPRHFNGSSGAHVARRDSQLLVAGRNWSLWDEALRPRMGLEDEAFVQQTSGASRRNRKRSVANLGVPRQQHSPQKCLKQ